MPRPAPVMRTTRPFSSIRVSRVRILVPLRGFEPLRDRLGAAQRAEDVSTSELHEVRLGPAAPDQLGEEIRIRRDVLETDGPVVVAVEVGTEPDVVDARDPAHVLD